MLESKTIKMWFLIFVGAVVFVFAAAAVDHYLALGVGNYVNPILQLFGLGGGVGTTRNVVADHLAPAWTQVQQAQTQAQATSPPPQSTMSAGGYKIP